MSDLIERQKAMDAVKDADVCVFYSDNQSIDDVLDYVIRATKGSVIASIEQLPSAQPEIIRCKDCENWIPGYITDNDDFIPPKCGKYQQMVGHSSDDYCSRAERKIDE